MGTRRFVLLDRDGTIIVERHYLSDPDDVVLLPGAASGLRRLRALGFGLALVTNQSAIGRGFFDEARLHIIHARVNQLLESEGIQFDAIYFCPHTPEDHCPCRKPETGMADQAALDLGFDPATAFVIGDNWSDIEMGRRIGATPILVRTGYGAKVAATRPVDFALVVDDLNAAADAIEHLATAVAVNGPIEIPPVPDDRTTQRGAGEK